MITDTPQALLDSLSNDIHRMIDTLRGDQLSKSDYHVILFLMLLHKDHLLDGLEGEEIYDMQGRLIDLLDGNLLEHNETLEDIYTHLYQGILNRLHYLNFGGLCKSLFNIDRQKFDVCFADLFDYALHQITTRRGVGPNNALLSEDLITFALSTVALPPDADVYNPYAEYASFRFALPKDVNYRAQEMDYTIWALATMRLFAHDKWVRSDLRCGNPIVNWNPFIVPNSKDTMVGVLEGYGDNRKHDLVVSKPPFAMSLRDMPPEFTGYGKTAEAYIILKGLEDLKITGSMLVFVSESFLFESKSRYVREVLIEKDLIELIVSFPSGILPDTGMPFSLLVINKKKLDSGSVRLINAKKLLVDDGSRRKRLDFEALKEAANKAVKSNSARAVSNTELAANDYILQVQRYLVSDYAGVKLSELLTPVHGLSTRGIAGAKLVRNRDLATNSARRLQLDDLEIPERLATGKFVEESCLLVSLDGNALKPTLFLYDRVGIAMYPGVYGFKIDDQKIDPDYLIEQLNKPATLSQVESYRLGAVIPRIRQNDFLNVKIEVLPLDQQKAMVAGIKEAIGRLDELRVERNKLVHSLEERMYENFASVKHSLGKPLLNISSAILNIENGLSRLSESWGEMMLSERLNVTLGDTFQSLKANVALVHSILDKNDRTLNVEEYSLERFDFLGFIKKYTNQLKATERAGVDVILDIHPDVSLFIGREVNVNGNAELLEVALNNLVENANKHAFIEPAKRYKIEIRVSLDFHFFKGLGPDEDTEESITLLRVEVANDGGPFPQKYGLDKFIRKNSFAGPTGNTGHGGYDVNEIVKRHNDGNSTLEIITDDETGEYSTIIAFTLPILI